MNIENLLDEFNEVVVPQSEVLGFLANNRYGAETPEAQELKRQLVKEEMDYLKKDYFYLRSCVGHFVANSMAKNEREGKDFKENYGSFVFKVEKIVKDRLKDDFKDPIKRGNKYLQKIIYNPEKNEFEWSDTKNPLKVIQSFAKRIVPNQTVIRETSIMLAERLYKIKLLQIYLNRKLKI